MFEYEDRCRHLTSGRAHVKPDHPKDYGDVWTWIAIDADAKLVPSWYVGGRTTTDALEFMRDVASRWTCGFN
jgi:hypothetical protein